MEEIAGVSMNENKPLLITISNDKWMDNHLRRWHRYAKKYSGCRLGLIAITENDALLWELMSAFDKVVVFNNSFDERKFYNKVRLMAPELFGEPVIYCDADADIWASLVSVMEEVKADGVEVACIKSPAPHKDWAKFKCGEVEVNNGFLVLNYGKERTKEIVETYNKMHDQVIEAGGNPRISGTIGFNKMFWDSDIKGVVLKYDNSVIWWDTLNLQNAKVIQWCNDWGQAKRLALNNDWIRGRGLFE